MQSCNCALNQEILLWFLASREVLEKNKHRLESCQLCELYVYSVSAVFLGEIQPVAHQSSGYSDDSMPTKVDGYSSIVAPHLRGEGDCPEMAYTSPIELRVVVCIQSILGLAPFWLDERGQMGNKLCVVIEGLQVTLVNVYPPSYAKRLSYSFVYFLFNSNSFVVAIYKYAKLSPNYLPEDCNSSYT